MQSALVTNDLRLTYIFRGSLNMDQNHVHKATFAQAKCGVGTSLPQAARQRRHVTIVTRE